MSTTGLTVKTIRIEPVTRASFAPFGTLLSPDGVERLPRHVYEGKIESYRPGSFESDRPVEWVVSRLGVRSYTVVYMERHFLLTQTFIPLGGNPIVMVVARPDARLENDIPAIDEIHAFLVPGDSAVNIHRGTWHEPPYPLVEGSIVLMTSHQVLLAGLASGLDENQELQKPDIDKRNVAERAGLLIRLELS
ncbi:MAG TPA: ureidoglycolate lyase [Candidatus Dormibacteraeota bacterium]|nr:ureidoglycolate lyase [Candidatus Dormibacteraeota bacterium]